MTTIYEVATHAGVSPATVSRVMNGRSVRPASAERVHAAVAELAYTPSRSARSLRTNNSQVIALIIPDIENPFFTALARGVEDETRAAGYSLVLCNTDDDSGRESTYVDIVLSEKMAGVIVAPASGGESLMQVLKHNRPIVAVDRPVLDAPIDSVIADNARGAAEATRRLHDRGYRQVACITGPQHIETAQQRSQGWRQIASLHGSPPEEYLQWADYRIPGGFTAMCDLLSLDTPPDAVVCTNNLLAVGALNALHQAGLTVSEFGFAVFGDLPLASALLSAIQIVPLAAREIGTTAARLLLDRIDGDVTPPRTIVIGLDGHVKL